VIAIGLPGGKDFAAEAPLRPSDALVVLLDAAAPPKRLTAGGLPALLEDLSRAGA
jgi:hypothetical protein